MRGLLLGTSSVGITREKWAFKVELARAKNAIGKLAGSYLVDFINPSDYPSKTIEYASKAGWLRKGAQITPDIRLQHILWVSILQSSRSATALLQQKAEDWEFEASNLPMNDPIPLSWINYDRLFQKNQLVSYTRFSPEQQKSPQIFQGPLLQNSKSREFDRLWYIKLADEEPEENQGFKPENRMFWDMLKTAWEDFFQTNTCIPLQIPPRFIFLNRVQRDFKGLDLKDPKIILAAKQKLRCLLGFYLSTGADSCSGLALSESH